MKTGISTPSSEVCDNVGTPQSVTNITAAPASEATHYKAFLIQDQHGFEESRNPASNADMICRSSGQKYDKPPQTFKSETGTEIGRGVPTNLANRKNECWDMFNNLDPRRRRRRPPYCSNCGCIGHSSKLCNVPTLSCGIILFRRRDPQRRLHLSSSDMSTLITDGDRTALLRQELICKDMDYFNLNSLEGYDKLKKFESDLIKSPPDECNINLNRKKDCDNEHKSSPQIEYLLVRRKDSLNFVEFVRGKYDQNDIKFIFQVFLEITKEERVQIAKKDFRLLWKSLWATDKDVVTMTNDFLNAEFKFRMICSGYHSKNGAFISIDILLKSTNSKYITPEWGFPKGRKNKRESDIDCAVREFFEETRCPSSDFAIIHDLKSVNETFKGSNNVFYKHLYFVAKHTSGTDLDLNLRDTDQLAEIGDMGWFSLDKALELFRPYDVERKSLLMRLDNLLSNFSFSEEAPVTPPRS